MQIPNKNTLIGKRDLAILELFYATGMRLSELVALNIGSVNHNDNLVKVVGKGNKERIIPFGNNAMSALKVYLKERGLAGFLIKTSLCFQLKKTNEFQFELFKQE